MKILRKFACTQLPRPLTISRRAIAASLADQAELLEKNRQNDLLPTVVDSSSDDEDDDLDAPVHAKAFKVAKRPIPKADDALGVSADSTLATPTKKEIEIPNKHHHDIFGSTVDSVTTSNSMGDQLKERRERMKRKAAGDELRTDSVKRTSTVAVASNVASTISPGSISFAQRSCKLPRSCVLL